MYSPVYSLIPLFFPQERGGQMDQLFAALQSTLSSFNVSIPSPPMTSSHRDTQETLPLPASSHTSTRTQRRDRLRYALNGEHSPNHRNPVTQCWIHVITTTDLSNFSLIRYLGMRRACYHHRTLLRSQAIKNHPPEFQSLRESLVHTSSAISLIS